MHDWEAHPQQAFAVRHLCKKCGMLRSIKQYPTRKLYSTHTRTRTTTTYYQNTKFIAENPQHVPKCENPMLDEQ